MNVMQIYDHLPIFLQNFAVSFEGYRIQKMRYDVVFREIYQDFMERNDWDYERKCEYRDNQLRKMVRHCYETVPYYRRVFNEYGINYEEIKRLDDLQRLPVINKQIVKANYDDFFPVSIRTKEI